MLFLSFSDYVLASREAYFGFPRGRESQLSSAVVALRR